MPAYKLTYFDRRGRAETARLLFAAAEVPYKDKRIPLEQWSSVKPGLSLPFGQLPLLEIDGKETLCQSNAINRYLARQFKLAGKNGLEQAQVDMIIDCIEDSIKPLMQGFVEKDEAKKAELKKKYLEEQLPTYLTYMEAILKGNNGGDHFLVGDALTSADLGFITFIGLTAAAAGAQNPLEKFPKLAALQKKVENLPKIAAWIAKRPKTDM